MDLKNFFRTDVLKILNVDCAKYLSLFSLAALKKSVKKSNFLQHILHEIFLCIK